MPSGEARKARRAEKFGTPITSDAEQKCNAHLNTNDDQKSYELVASSSTSLVIEGKNPAASQHVEDVTRAIKWNSKSYFPLEMTLLQLVPRYSGGSITPVQLTVMYVLQFMADLNPALRAVGIRLWMMMNSQNRLLEAHERGDRPRRIGRIPENCLPDATPAKVLKPGEKYRPVVYSFRVGPNNRGPAPGGVVSEPESKEPE